MAATYSCLLVHIIFSTKQREALIRSDLAADLYSYMGGIARSKRCVLLAAGGMPDHVHLLVSLHPTVAVAAIVRDIKANSSSWVRERGVREFAWQDGYGPFSVSKSNLETVRAYVNSQEEHHRTKTFQEEYVEFLERHGVEYDRRYVFD